MDKTQISLLTLTGLFSAVATYSSRKNARLKKHYRFKYSMQRKNWAFSAGLFWVATVISAVVLAVCTMRHSHQ